MSIAIRERDPRFEQARSLAAEQQALRTLRAQQSSNQPAPFQESAQTALRPSEAQEISRQGLISSRRLAREFGGMLRDKPKFTFFEARSQAPKVEGTKPPAPDLPQAFTEFIPSQVPQLPLFNPRARARLDREDENSLDLNLSEENRQRVLAQGLPGTTTGRAAMDVILQARTGP